MILTKDIIDRSTLDNLIRERWNAGRNDPIVPKIKQVSFVYKNNLFVGVLFYYTHIGSNKPCSLFFMPQDITKETVVRTYP